MVRFWHFFKVVLILNRFVCCPLCLCLCVCVCVCVCTGGYLSGIGFMHPMYVPWSILFRRIMGWCLHWNYVRGMFWFCVALDRNGGVFIGAYCLSGFVLWTSRLFTTVWIYYRHCCPMVFWGTVGWCSNFPSDYSSMWEFSSTSMYW